MIYVALVEAVAVVLIVGAFTGLLRSKDRAQARERDLLLNQLLHAVDRPWQPAPADNRHVEQPDLEGLLEERLARHYDRFTTSPEQEP